MLNPKEALKYAQLTMITEDVDLRRGLEEMKDKITALGYTYLHTIHGSQLATYFTPRLGEETMFGYIAREADGTLMVILRSTGTLLEALHDAAFWQIPNPIPNARATFVSAGFSSVYQSLRVFEDMKEIFLKPYLDSLTKGVKTKIVIAGHSLGGALASLLGLDLALNVCTLKSPKIYTFGSPRTGDPLFANLYNKHIKESYRIVEKWDPVQMVPILPAYYHVDEKIQIKMPWNWNPLKHHKLRTYISILENL